ncbi:sensor histidine kinase [Bosea thiooxidans]
MSNSFDWIRRPTISRRIALAMVLALIAVQGQAFLQIWLFSRPEIQMLGTRWLAETTRDAARSVFAAPTEERAALATRVSKDGLFEVTWSRELPFREPDDRENPLLKRLGATLGLLVENDAASFRIVTTTLSYAFPNRGFTVEIRPDPAALDLGSSAVGPQEPDILVPGNLKIAVQGRDGSWVGLKPVGLHDDGWFLHPPLTPLLVGALIIAVVSVLITRSLVSPLDGLVDAANRLGSARELVEVKTEGLAEFGTVADAFVTMQKRLLRFVDDRTQMLAAISHDLRSSLTRLRLASEEVSEDEQREALTREIGEMAAMLDSTLAFARGDAHRAPSERLDLAALLITLVDDANDRGIACSYTGPNHCDLVGDPLSLKRAFSNLINNAIKYGLTAQVSLKIDGDQLVVRIEDEGPGIPDDRMDEALAPFRRLDPARSGNLPGAGLGLTIAHDAVQAHGGSLKLDNLVDGGLRVEVALHRPL